MDAGSAAGKRPFRLPFPARLFPRPLHLGFCLTYPLMVFRFEATASTGSTNAVTFANLTGIFKALLGIL